ncbi:6-phosphogluconate dehydrogenase [Colletotrichum musicola]|uniref:6-phosphogluconate dehydrogenase n=1 Tax=Colletotrichum musicola TaxID=2175873 RepID=A0A8H6U592_9PEZI|nr:6-phosphogluconate dehydrogenase [Colletotrichum musicola]
MYSTRVISRLSHAVHGTSFRRCSSNATRFSVHSRGDSTKASRVNSAQKLDTKARSSQDALVILASRKYAPWLQDSHFMSALLEPFSGGLSTGESSGELNVLAAAVDGLHPLHPFGGIPHGFSFYHGSHDVILPNLWRDNQPKVQRDSKMQAAIKVHLNSMNQTPSTTACTLPLANTIFQNGLQSTLLASRWRRSGAESPLELTRIAMQQSQDLVFSVGSTASATTLEAPLVPITAPRKILAGLGNIISQIEVDGKPTPASKELEIAVTQLFDRRTKEGHEFPPGPVGVWAVVVPPATTQVRDIGLLQEWSNRIDEKSTAEDEWKQVLETRSLVQEFLGNGAMVYRILSGGGGWGKKQGLLSLDPETKYSPSEEDDLDSFIQSFSSQHDGSVLGGVVAPGSYVQYFVSPPAGAKPAVSVAERPSTSIAFGTSEAALGEAVDSTKGPSDWEFVPGHFGAVTSHGLFVAGKSSSGTFSETKLDVPDAWIGYSS